MIQLQVHAFHKNLNLNFLWNKILNKAYTDVSGYSTGLVSLEKYNLKYMSRSIEIFMGLFLYLFLFHSTPKDKSQLNNSMN